MFASTVAYAGAIAAAALTDADAVLLREYDLETGAYVEIEGPGYTSQPIPAPIVAGRRASAEADLVWTPAGAWEGGGDITKIGVVDRATRQLRYAQDIPLGAGEVYPQVRGANQSVRIPAGTLAVQIDVPKAGA